MAETPGFELQGLIHYIGRLREASARGVRAALADTPKCRFGMLERLHYAICTYGIDGVIGVSELARAAGKPLPAVSRALRLLEQDGMAERRTDPEDRRKTLVRITPAGQQALRDCEAALNAYFTRVMARLEPAQLERMMEMRNVLVDALEAETAATLRAAKTKEDPDDGKDL
ncbi:MarR family winged helix-turn-helix transcriptional regulator [Subdoligranulum variabile]|uniref:MarR family winged helix-turn-helix transcriptional regulator n=1 Tax=Subdoligranulum variabile TaxID=214851 RepID=UPI00031B8314|nr:MarR family transcriptional regulator [Subdoligranulum variabile]UWP69237.1 MarR family transcriptional regulator [Subdoligranulum variabile]